MSLREKAREVKAAGEAERGNFTPSGAPLRLYNYWLNNAPDRSTLALRMGTKKENFCHFWRVVAIWAPLRALLNGIEALFTNPVFLVALAALAVVGIVMAGLTWSQFGVVTLIVLGILYGAAGLIFGAVYAAEKYDRDHFKPFIMYDGKPDPYDLPPEIDQPSKWIAIATLPVSWITFAVAYISKGLDSSTKEFIGNAIIVVLLAAIVGFFLVMGFVNLGWWFLLVLLAIGAVFVLLIGVVIALGHVFESLRAYTRKKALEREAVEAAKPFVNKPVVKKEPREPGVISKFFSGIADFLILAAQIARVNKWKICPLVTIDQEKTV